MHGSGNDGVDKDSDGGAASPSHAAYVDKTWLRRAGLVDARHAATFRAAGGVTVASLIALHRCGELEGTLRVLGVDTVGSRRLLCRAVERESRCVSATDHGAVGDGVCSVECAGHSDADERDAASRSAGGSAAAVVSVECAHGTSCATPQSLDAGVRRVDAGTRGVAAPSAPPAAPSRPASELGRTSMVPAAAATAQHAATVATRSALPSGDAADCGVLAHCVDNNDSVGSGGGGSDHDARCTTSDADDFTDSCSIERATLARPSERAALPAAMPTRQIHFEPPARRQADVDECAPCPTHRGRSVHPLFDKTQWWRFQPSKPAKRQRATAWNTATAARPVSQDDGGKRYRPESHPFYKRVPGTDITVDSFRAPHGSCHHFFLTHFHGDHYGGMKKSAFPPDGPWRIYCTDATANCLRSQLGMSESVLVRVPLCTNTTSGVRFDDDVGDNHGGAGGSIEVTANVVSDDGSGHRANHTGATTSVHVWAVDANHCPGAAMFIFRVANGGERNAHQFYLHCGDFRYDAEQMRVNAVLASFAAGDAASPAASDHVHGHDHGRDGQSESRGGRRERNNRRLSAIYLDTTYCDPRYGFVPQRDALRAVADEAQRDAARMPTLFLCGTYSIGKERVWIAVARALGTRVYATAAKRRLIHDCFPSDANDGGRSNSDAHGSAVGANDTVRALVTDRPCDADVHLVPMGAVAWKPLEHALRRAQRQRRPYRQVVGIRPTGWNHRGADTDGAALRRVARGACVQYAVTYSEHSSYHELREFVQWMQSARVIPTVNNRSREQVERMRACLAPPSSSAARRNW